MPRKKDNFNQFTQFFKISMDRALMVGGIEAINEVGTKLARAIKKEIPRGKVREVPQHDGHLKDTVKYIGAKISRSKTKKSVVGYITIGDDDHPYGKTLLTGVSGKTHFARKGLYMIFHRKYWPRGFFRGQRYTSSNTYYRFKRVRYNQKANDYLTRALDSLGAYERVMAEKIIIEFRK